MSNRLPHVREPSYGEPDVCVHCREEWVDLLTLYETDECSVRLRAEVERLREDVATFSDDFVRVTSQACAPDEMHCSCVPHLRAHVERLRGEAAQERAAERAAVVAGLRDEVDMRAPDRAGIFLRCAEAIERGEHRREGGE